MGVGTHTLKMNSSQTKSPLKYTKYVMCFYKGTCLPIPKDLWADVMKSAQNDKFYPEQSSKFFKDFLTHVESRLRKKGKNTTSNLEETLQGIYPDTPAIVTAMTWVSAIAVLLQRKVIQNDLMNGWLSFDLDEPSNAMMVHFC